MFVRVLRDFGLRAAVNANGLPTDAAARRCLHVTRPAEKNRDRRSFLASVPPKDEGTEGEKFVSIDAAITKWVSVSRLVLVLFLVHPWNRVVTDAIFVPFAV